MNRRDPTPYSLNTDSHESQDGPQAGVLKLYQSDVTENSLGFTIERWREYRGDLEDYALRLARRSRKSKVSSTPC